MQGQAPNSGWQERRRYNQTGLGVGTWPGRAKHPKGDEDVRPAYIKSAAQCRRWERMCSRNKPVYFYYGGVWWVMDRNGREWADAL